MAFMVHLSLIGSKEMIWIVSFVMFNFMAIEDTRNDFAFHICAKIFLLTLALKPGRKVFQIAF